MNIEFCAEANQIYETERQSLHINTDRRFALLMLIQWALCIGLALWVSPYIWMTAPGDYHHLFIAFFAGGLICVFPIYMSVFRPGDLWTRYIIALAQMSFSSLIIFILKGRIEGHFHIFGSLAFLAAYRDCRLLGTAASLAIADHIFRGYFFPISIYGTDIGTQWRWVEHTGWILFECSVLYFICRRADYEMRRFADAIISRTRYLSFVSHEMRTPLSAIVGFTDLLKDNRNPIEQKEYLGFIRQCSDSLLTLINTLLDYSKIESGRLEIDQHSFCATDLHQYLHNVFHLECRNKQIDLALEIRHQTPVYLVGDSLRIKQVLTNLVANAVKFTKKGKVEVVFSESPLRGDLFQWEVHDTGIGIQKERLEKIFQPFSQENSSTARQYGGTGLGLAITKGLVENMGGQIQVKSWVGKGTSFVITLPLKPQPLDLDLPMPSF